MNVGEIEYTVAIETEESIKAADKSVKSLDNVEKKMREAERQSEKLGVSMKKLATAISGVIAISGVVSEFSRAIDITKEFNATISNLSALTGLVGDDLKRLEDAAKRIGATTSLSATQAAAGMKLIGSQIPELLKSTDALESVTKAAAVLAEAAGTSLPEAAQAISGAINQFKLGAKDTDDIINTLAAGAKEGASSVQETAAALAVAGTTAEGAGVSFGEFNALVQTLAKGQITASEAGTALRNVILKLDTSVDKNLRPSVVGMGAALRNLQKEVASGTTTYEAFGLVNKTAADVLLQNIDYYEKTEAAIKGTNEAYDQQAKNNDNLKTDLDALSSAYENILITVGQKVDPVFRSFTQTLTEMLSAVAKSDDGVSTLDNMLNLAAAAGASMAAVMARQVVVSIGSYVTAQYSAITATLSKIKADKAAAALTARRAAAEKIAAMAVLDTAKAELAAAKGATAHAAALNNLNQAKARALSATAAYNSATAALGATAVGATTAVTALRAAMSFLGGPAGVAMLAAAAFFAFSGSSKEVETSLIDLRSPLDETIAKFKELSDVAQKEALRRAAQDVRDAEQEYRSFGTEIANVLSSFRREWRGASDETVTLMGQIAETSRAISSGVQGDFGAMYKAIESNAEISEELKAVLLGLVGQAEAAANSANSMKSGLDQLNATMLETESDAKSAASGIDQLSESMRTGSAAARDYARDTTRALEDMQDKSALGKLMRDIRDNADAWKDATKEQMDAAVSAAMAVDAYNASVEAKRKADSAATKAANSHASEQKRLADEAKRNAEHNQKAIKSLQDALKGASLGARELAQEQAALTLNKYATPEQIAEVKQLAAALYNAKKAMEFDEVLSAKDQHKNAISDIDSLLAARKISEDQHRQYTLKAEQELQKKLRQIAYDEDLAQYDKGYAAQSDFDQKMADLNALLEAQKISEDQHREYTLNAERELKEQLMQLDQERFESQSIGNQMLMKSLDGVKSHAADAFIEFASGAKSGGDAAKALGQAIGQSVIKALVDMGVQMAVNAVKEKLFAAQSVSTAATAGTSIATAYTPAATAASIASFGGAAAAGLAGMAAAIPAMMSMFGGGREHGGPVDPSKFYRVNEGGKPELLNVGNKQYLMPNQRGEVVSNKDATAGGGGMVFNVSIAVEGVADAEQARQQGIEFSEAFVSGVQRVINSNLSPGGAIWQTVK